MTTGVRGLAPSIGDPVRADRRRCPFAVAGVAVWRGTFGAAEAERLLWRAGFGPRPGEAQRLARLGLEGAVHKLTHPAREHLVGHRPHDEKGRPLAPLDAWGHDHVWWLDRMVRTSRPLVERMTLIWHDWFATSNNGVGSQRLMLNQNQLFRRQGLGSFHELLIEVTEDPAMLLWLNGSDNSKDSPNENYAREMMELFTFRRRPRLHRRRRSPAGACPHRLPEQLEPEQRTRQLPLRLGGPRSGPEDHLPVTGADSPGRTRAASASHILTTRRSSSRSSGATSSPRLRTTPRSARSSGSTKARSTRCGQSSPRSCATLPSTQAPGL